MNISADDLADIVGKSPKTVRAWLRIVFPRPDREKNTEWIVTPRMRVAAEYRWS